MLQVLWSEIALYCGFEFFFLVILLSMLFFVAWVLQDWSKIASWNCFFNCFRPLEKWGGWEEGRERERKRESIFLLFCWPVRSVLIRVKHTFYSSNLISFRCILDTTSTFTYSTLHIFRFFFFLQSRFCWLFNCKQYTCILFINPQTLFFINFFY